MGYGMTDVILQLAMHLKNEYPGVEEILVRDPDVLTDSYALKIRGKTSDGLPIGSVIDINMMDIGQGAGSMAEIHARMGQVIKYAFEEFRKVKEANEA